MWKLSLPVFRFNLQEGLLQERNLAVVPEGQLLVDTWRDPRVHVVRECVGVYAQSYIVTRKWPLLGQVDDIVARLLEAGLLEHWRRATLDKFVAACHVVNGDLGDVTRAYKALTVKDLGLAFNVLTVGLVLSFACLVLECLVKSLSGKVHVSQSARRISISF